MNILRQFGAPYLGVDDLNGEKKIVTIAGFELKTNSIGGSIYQEPVLYFRELYGRFVLDEANATTIAEVLGTNETDEWIGRRIILFPGYVKFLYQVEWGIRVSLRPPEPATKADANAPPEEPLIWEEDTDWLRDGPLPDWPIGSEEGSQSLL